MTDLQSATQTAKIVLLSLLIALVVLFLSFWNPKNGKTFVDADSQRKLTDSERKSIHLVLDAGHGGEDGGASANGVNEKEVNLAVTSDLATFLRFTPYTVKPTRTDDRLLYGPGEENRKKYYDLMGRINFASQFDNAVFISIHQNKFEIPKYKGLQVYYSKNHPLSMKLAEHIQENAKTYLDSANNREVKKADHRIRVLNSLQIPSVLVECGFLSNAEEAKLLASRDYQKKIAFTVFLSTLDFLENDIKISDLS